MNLKGVKSKMDFTAEELGKMTLAQIKQVAKELKLKNVSNLKKSELLEIIAKTNCEKVEEKIDTKTVDESNASEKEDVETV